MGSKWRLLLVLFLMIHQCSASLSFGYTSRDSSNNQDQNSQHPPVQLHTPSNNYVVMDNGILNLTLSVPLGQVTGIQYNGVDNILETRNKESDRGYWNVNWYTPQQPNDHYYTVAGTSFKVIMADENQIEVSFTRSWNSSGNGYDFPLNMDIRYVMLRGSSGFYAYGIFERLDGWPALGLGEARIAFKLRDQMFHYLAITDSRQGLVPTGEDRSRGQTLEYREAVRITNPFNPNLTVQVDDKYQYSCENKDNRVHGWISSNPTVGFWVITPTDEFRHGGPVKQELTSHVTATSLAIFFSNHYGGPVAMNVNFGEGESWKKVMGPIFFYLNSASNDEDPYKTVWSDAKKQMSIETKKWPYDFPLSPDFSHADQRGTVEGRLRVRDRYINEELIAADSAFVGLASPGDVGSWQTETKGYQFWTQADGKGNFSIKSVRPGAYNLYAWVPNFIGDYKYNVLVNVTPGSKIQLGDLIYNPPRNGPTLWKIGIPDRRATEFYVPDPSPEFRNPMLAKGSDRLKQYGLWDRYTDLYPDQDLVYRVGSSNYQTDWFYAHVTRKTKNETYQGTMWQIEFNLTHVDFGTSYTLQLALAAANIADVEVRINDRSIVRPHFTTRQIGRDNAIARHGTHGLYWLYSIEVSSNLLSNGINSIFLTQPKGGSPFTGLMYDYIRFEGPPSH